MLILSINVIVGLMCESETVRMRAADPVDRIIYMLI